MYSAGYVASEPPRLPVASLTTANAIPQVSPLSQLTCDSDRKIRAYFQAYLWPRVIT
jgi:hypothetical protein